MRETLVLLCTYFFINPFTCLITKYKTSKVLCTVVVKFKYLRVRMNIKLNG